MFLHKNGPSFYSISFDWSYGDGGRSSSIDVDFRLKYSYFIGCYGLSLKFEIFHIMLLYEKSGNLRAICFNWFD